MLALRTHLESIREAWLRSAGFQPAHIRDRSILMRSPWGEHPGRSHVNVFSLSVDALPRLRGGVRRRASKSLISKKFPFGDRRDVGGDAPWSADSQPAWNSEAPRGRAALSAEAHQAIERVGELERRIELEGDRPGGTLMAVTCDSRLGRLDPLHKESLGDVSARPGAGSWLMFAWNECPVRGYNRALQDTGEDSTLVCV